MIYSVVLDRQQHNDTLAESGSDTIDYSDEDIPYSKLSDVPKDIITLRNMFYAYKVEHPDQSYI